MRVGCLYGRLCCGKIHTYIDTQTVRMSPEASLRSSSYLGVGSRISSSPPAPPCMCKWLPPAQNHRTIEAGRQPPSTFSLLPLHAWFLAGALFSSVPASCHPFLNSCMSRWTVLELEEEIINHQTALCTLFLFRAISQGILPSGAPSRSKPAVPLS